MQHVDTEPHACLRPSLWAGRLALGRVVLTLSVNRASSREQPLYPLANRVALARRERHLSRPELARRLFIHPATLAALEEGRYQPSLNLALRISELLNLPVEALFFSPDTGCGAEVPISTEE